MVGSDGACSNRFFGVEDLGFGVQGKGSGFWGFGFWIEGLKAGAGGGGGGGGVYLIVHGTLLNSLPKIPRTLNTKPKIIATNSNTAGRVDLSRQKS